MTKKLRIAQIGVGGMGSVHLRLSHAKNPRIELVALCDLIPERCERMRRELGREDIAVYTDYREMIEKEQLDAVDIVTPNDLHSVIAVYALEHGLNVFCEKPDAVSVEEALKMQAAAEASGKVLMVMRNNRYTQKARYLKDFIASGAAGEIYCGRCGWIRRRGIPGRGGWFTTKARSGGGPLIDLGVHMIDLAIWLMGSPRPVAVSGCTYSKFSGDESAADSEHAAFGDAQKGGTFDVEDLAMGFIRFENGACLQIEFSWASNIKEEKRFVELRGTKAGISWQGDGAEIYTEQNGYPVDLRRTDGDPSSEHDAALRHFTRIILDGEEKDYVPQQGVDMIRILTALYESAETGKEVRL
ncbi:MAG: Gfo/Idh/MocA family oxidoreductase [Oscillospiraceae bacterium]|nr:Gfo/Idh/MocA family oxidoreductase [Oscillospiraceae bacterium]